MIKNLLDRLKKGEPEGSFDSVADIQKPSRPGAPPAMQAHAQVAQVSQQAPIQNIAPRVIAQAPQAPASIPIDQSMSSIPRPAHVAFRREAPPKPINFDYSDLLKEENKPSLESGVIIELGAGISLNVPIKKKMDLDEFLKIAEKVRNLEKLEIVTSEMRG